MAPSKTDAKSTIMAQFAPGTQPPVLGAPSQVTDATSNLLDSTPPQIVRALAQAEPLVRGLNTALGLLTWTSGNDWQSFFLLVGWWVTCLYGFWIVKFAGNFVPVAIIALAYTLQRASAKNTERTSTHASLTSTLKEIDILRTRIALFLTPPSLLLPHLTLPASQPLLLRLCFAWPVWLLITHKILVPKKIVLLLGSAVLCWSSPWARIIGIALWRSRTIRKAASAVIGRNLLEEPDLQPSTSALARKSLDVPAETMAEGHKPRTSTSSIQDVLGGGIKITQTLYQSQRRWIGIGWTSNLFPNERSAWADETEHPALPIDEFVLPPSKSSPHTLPTGEKAVRVAKWRWIDPEWKPVIKPNETDAEGWIYTDNTWKNPGPVEAFGKYTRRRKFLRISELTEEILPTEPEPRSPILQSYPSPRVGNHSPRSSSGSPRIGGGTSSVGNQGSTTAIKMEAPGRSQMEIPGQTSTSPSRPGGGDAGGESLENDIREAVGLVLTDAENGNSSLGESRFGADV